MEFPLPPVTTPADALGGLSLALAAAGSARLALKTLARVRIRVRVRRPLLPPPFARVVSLAGLTFAFASGPAVAGTRPPVSPDRRTPNAAPPWSEAGGFPPPRPLARIEAGSQAPTRPPRSQTRSLQSPHPAVHRIPPEGTSSESSGERLFPRAADRDVDPELAAAMRRHPSGQLARRHHRVRPGDSLWSIAEEILGTDDPRAVARYWPRIHRENRAVIGADPSLIRPGQILELPERD